MAIFVVHSHFSKNHHYDLRLEYGNSLKSWAIPKIPPLKSGIKRLAVQVPNHPLSYARFQGTIESGYGTGKVKIWDKGTFSIISKNNNKLLVNFKGKKLKGRYTLIRFKNKNWLFFKQKI
ncbi:MAG: DNA polymerase ligase N-terminal domain-containing protein [Nanoarchaeota archaeon]